MIFRIGDKVKIKPYDTIKYWHEEAKPQKIYIVSETRKTISGQHYVQLKGVYSSYSFECLELVERKF